MTSTVVAAAESDRVAVADREIRANRRRAHVLAVGAGAVPGVVVGLVLGAVAGPVAGVVAAVVVAAFVAVVVSRRATTMVLGIVGGRPLADDAEPRQVNLVDGLCATFGVPRPRLWLVEDPVPNVCALGRRPSAAVLVVTSGLLGRLGLIETEGVVAHELAHVKRHDTAVSEVAVALCYPLAGARGAVGLVHRALGRGREYRADEVAAATCATPRVCATPWGRWRTRRHRWRARCSPDDGGGPPGGCGSTPWSGPGPTRSKGSSTPPRSGGRPWPSGEATGRPHGAPLVPFADSGTPGR